MINLEILKIKEYRYWNAMLHHNQSYLGRCVVWCRRQGVTDLLDMTDDESAEFFKIAKKLRSALKEAFSPDLFNYASFSNVTAHLHFHIIPRYQVERVFGGLKFVDKNWGGSPFPYDKNFTIDDALMIKIRDRIAEKLK